MAERRMFAKTIVLSDAFLDMPITARCLYFTLGMVADDDGFVNSPKSIMRQIRASEGDMMALVSNKFIIPFESGIVVIKHWRVNNYLRNDRYFPTKYEEEKEKLTVGKNGVYHSGIPSVGIPSIGKDSIGKDSIGKDSGDGIPSPTRTKFQKPTIDDVKAYCTERGNSVDPERFVDYYESNGWKVGKNPMKDWKAAVRTWERGSKQQKNTQLDQWANA